MALEGLNDVEAPRQLAEAVDAPAVQVERRGLGYVTELLLSVGQKRCGGGVLNDAVPLGVAALWA